MHESLIRATDGQLTNHEWSLHVLPLYSPPCAKMLRKLSGLDPHVAGHTWVQSYPRVPSQNLRCTFAQWEDEACTPYSPDAALYAFTAPMSDWDFGDSAKCTGNNLAVHLQKSPEALSVIRQFYHAGTQTAQKLFRKQLFCINSVSCCFL